MNLLVTDGDCGFCQRSAIWLERHFPGDWENTPNQSADLETLGLSKSQVQSQVWFVFERKGEVTHLGGAQAVAKLLLVQPKFYIKPFAYLAFLPGIGQIAQALYKSIAKNRGKFSSSTANCEVSK